MTGIYRRELPYGARLEVDTTAFSNVLIGAGTPRVNAIAKQASQVAKDQVRPSGKRFIGFRAARPFQVESTEIGSPRSLLSSRLRIPVALVFNNSLYAVQQEVGSLRADKKAERPLTTALRRVKSGKSIRAIRATDLGARVDFGAASRASRRKGRRR